MNWTSIALLVVLIGIWTELTRIRRALTRSGSALSSLEELERELADIGGLLEAHWGDAIDARAGRESKDSGY